MSNKNINSQVSLCLKDCKLFENKDTKVKDLDNLLYKNEESYQKSFDDIIEFSKKISTQKKKAINLVIYHDENEDGLFSAYITWKFLTENGKGENIEFLPMKPASSHDQIDYRLQKMDNELEGKNAILLDISYSKVNLKYILERVKSLIVIDDHPRSNNLSELNKLTNHTFIGDDKHSAVAYTWKFFYPKKDVPMFAQYVDNNDRKLHLPYLVYDNLIRTYNNFRITHNPYTKKYDSVKTFEYIIFRWKY